MPQLNIEVTNQTHFARHMRVANMHLLEGLALIGSRRMDQIQAAKVALVDAMKATDNDEEIIVARAVMDGINQLEARGLDR